MIVGAGTRLFPEEGRDFALELLESRTFPTGIIAQTYRPDRAPAGYAHSAAVAA